MLSSKSDKMTACDQMTVKFSLYMPHFQVAYQTKQLLLNKFFDSMLSLESDKMTVLWRDDSITLVFYVTFSNVIPHWTIFDSMLSLESDQKLSRSLFCCISIAF